MPAYLLTYHGGQLPKGEEDEAELSVAWYEWLDAIAEALIDAGNPTGESVRLGPDGTLQEAGDERTSGYSIIEADDLEAATLIARSCPVLSLGGSIEVSELIELDLGDDFFEDEDDEDEDEQQRD